MSISERKLKYNLSLAKYYYSNRNTDITYKDKSIEIIKECYEPFTSNLYHTLQTTSSDNIVELAEVAFTVSLPEIASNLVKIYFEQDSSTTLSKNSYYVRALLVKALVESKIVQDKSLKAEEAANALVAAVKSIQQGLDIISKPENKQKYAATLYNASIITINILKNYLKTNWAKNFWDVLEKLSSMLEENDDVDFNWRIFILIKLAQCYIDADKKPEGQKALDKISDILKKKGDCDFMDELYRIRIHYSRDNSGALANLKKEGESTPAYPQFKFLYTVQAIKSNIITDKDIDKEVSGVIQAICPEFYKNISAETGKYKSEISVKIESWKADVLAELAFAIMKFKTMMTTAYNLYFFLFQNGSNSLKGKIYLENIHSQKVIYDLEESLKENVQPSEVVKQKRIQAATEALNILDKNMSGCARLQDYNLINETSMLIFNIATPFFKNPYRKIFYKAFYTACDQLEQINSNENYLRAAMHFELAKYYIEEDLLQEANTNLLKALNNDYSIPVNKLGAGSGQSGNANAKKGGNAAQATGTDSSNLTNSLTNNVSYLQRNLEQYLIYLKRYIGVKVNIYEDPDNAIDKLIFECDNVKNARNETIQKETINKCLKLIEEFQFDQFKVPPSDRDFVDEEINEMKMKHDLKLYDDKKHFILICSELSKYCYKYSNYEAVFKIDQAISKFLEELNNEKDVDQLIGLSETKIECAKCYSEYLLEEGIELCANNYSNFNDANKQYDDKAKEKFDEWRNKLYNNLQEACRIAVLANQNWLIFNVGITLWNFIKPMLDGPNYLSLINDNLLNVFNDLFEALNNSMSYYESIGSEFTDTDYFAKVDSFVSLASLYGKILEFKQRPDDCIRICDIMLTRKLDSKYRKIFDTLRAKASKVPSDPNAKKGKPPAKAPAPGKKDAGNAGAFVPSQDMNLISDCFSNLENAINSDDEKTKSELLKKGIEMLKGYKINFHDENTLELNSELWYKHGVQFFSLKNNQSYKYGMMCAENCVKTYDNIDIADNPKRKNISLQLQKWYCLGFLLYGDCLLNLVNIEKQERLVQIQLYFSAIEKILVSAKIAEKAKQYLVILNDLKAFYSVVINVIDMPQNREKLTPKFLNLHQILVNNRQGGSILYSDPEFLLLFYSLFCLCVNETRNWELGEKIICEAIKIIPNEFQHILLEHKLFYYSKQGKNFMQNISSTPSQGSGTGGDKDILTKAKLFTKLAKSSTNKIDQFNAYNRAIELLKNDQNVYVCNVIFELSSWLYKNNYPFKDVEENLNTAADIILEIESIFDEEDDIDEEGGDLKSKRSSSSRKSRLSKKSKSKKSGVSNKSKSKKRASVTGVGGKSKASERSKSRNYSSHTSKTKTIFAKMLDYDPYPLYMNLNHMEYLFKIQVFLSIVCNDYFKKQEYLLDGFFVLRKMIEMSIKTMNCIEFYERNKDEINSQGLTGNNEVNPLMSLVNNYYIAKDLNIPQYYSIPENLDGWLIYEWPENFINRIKMENEINSSPQNVLNNANVSLPNYTFFCLKSFETPYQFFYYFNYMVDKFMNEYYFHSECLLLIKFGILYSKYILNDTNMEFAFNLKYSRLVNNIVYNDPSNPSSVNIYKNLNSMLVDMPKLTADTIQKKRDELRKYDLKLKSDNENSFMPTGPENVDVIIKYIDDLLPHVSWIELAKEYFKSGYFNFSKDYSEEAKFHSLVLKDKDNFIKTNLTLANIAFIESNFDLSSKIFNKIQSINQSPEMMFSIIRDMTYIFDYMGKYEEMNTYLGAAIEYFDKDLPKVKNETYSSSYSLFYQMYTYSLINQARGLIKKYSENIKLNEYNIVKEQKSDMNTLLMFYKNEILPIIQKYKDMSTSNSMNLYNIHSLLDYILLSLECLTKNNLFVYVNLQELNVLTDLFEKNLTTLEDISGYLNKLQSYIPIRMDNSLIYLPIHRLMAYSKILYAIMNNIIGEFKNRIKRENYKNEELSMDDQALLKEKFGKDVRYNQVVIDYLNSLTKKINEMESLDNRDNIENKNRYEKSISLLISCESLIPKYSNEYLLYSIEKINSYRLQATHLKELKYIWDEGTIEAVNELQKEKENPEEISPNTESEFNMNQVPQKDEKKLAMEEKITIRKFHQMTINQISDFEKNILDNDKFKRLLRYHYKDLLKYYINVIESTGYLNMELTFKSIADYQNSNVKNYFNDVIKKYVNPQSRDWATFALYNKTKNTFSFECPFSYIYSSVSNPESLENYEKYLEDIPYYKNANENFYTQMKELKELLPNNSSFLIFQMNEDKSILYVGFMMISGPERKFSYYIKRIILNKKINKTFDDFIQTLKALKYSLVKTVLITKEEMERLFKEQNDKLNKVIYDFENNFPEMKPIFDDLDNLINPKIVENVETNIKDQPVEPKEKDKDKKGAKKPPEPTKKKEKAQAAPSDLPLPTSNLEQITFLIDLRLSDIPFECFNIFSKIPFKSNDFSLNTYVMRLKKENFNPNTVSSISLPGNVKYYLDYSKDQEFKLNIKDSVANHLGSSSSGGGKNAPVSPSLEGIVSSEHKPSIAELQKLYMNSTTFIFTSQTALLYQFPFEIFDTSKYSTCKIGIIIDRISNLKNFVDQNSLTPKTFSFNNQPLDTVAMMSLSGVDTILTTRWSIDYDQANELLDDTLDESINKNVNLSYAINKFKLPKRVSINNENEEGRAESALSKKSKGKKPPSSKGKKDAGKKKDENVVLDETNSVEVKKLSIYSCAPTVFGLSNVKLV